MLSCTDMQRRFIYAFLEEGGDPRRIMAAAETAGYSAANKNTLMSAASRLLHDPKIVAAIKEEADMRVRAGAILGASVLVKIAGDDQDKNQLKAAIELLNRADLIVASRQEIVVDDRRVGRAELLERARMLAERAGIDPVKLLAPFIEGEFKEIVDDEDEF